MLGDRVKQYEHHGWEHSPGEPIVSRINLVVKVLVQLKELVANPVQLCDPIQSSASVYEKAARFAYTVRKVRGLFGYTAAGA